MEKNGIRRIGKLLLPLLILTIALSGTAEAYAADIWTKNTSHYKHAAICKGEKKYKGMTVHYYNQRYSGYTLVSNAKKKPTNLNRQALPNYYSCNVFSAATALSALTGKEILPNHILNRAMKSEDLNAWRSNNQYGTNWSCETKTIAKRAQGYLKKEYQYQLYYETFEQKYKNKNCEKKVKKYLRNGYMVTLLVDGAKHTTFSKGQHWITLVGIDSKGKIITVNANGRTGFMKKYSWKTIERCAPGYFKVGRGVKAKPVAVAWRYQFDDSAKATTAEQVTLLKEAKAFEHLVKDKGYGYFKVLPAGETYAVKGQKGNYFKIQVAGKTCFIAKSAVNIIAPAPVEEPTLPEDSGETMPAEEPSQPVETPVVNAIIC